MQEISEDLNGALKSYSTRQGSRTDHKHKTLPGRNIF